MRIFISGGCKNGKSTHGQQLAKKQCGQSDTLYFIATMKPSDDEDIERIARHRYERKDLGFTTVEQPTTIEEILEKCDHNASFILDSLTALLANEMFLQEDCFDREACGRVAKGINQVLDTLSNIVIVSDYIYSDANLYDPLTESYRKSLATLDRLVASKCDVVIEIIHAQIVIHKGEELLKEVQHAIH